MDWPEVSLTWQTVEYWARATPDSEALVFGEERKTWREFARRVDATAKALLELGVTRGSCVAMISMARTEFAELFMATNKVGAVWLGLSPKLSVEELRHILEDARPSVLVTLRSYRGSDLAEAGAAMVRELEYVRHILMLGEPVEPAEPYDAFIERSRPHLDDELAGRASGTEPGDPVLLMYTSGSTGKPKGVVHTHASVLCSAKVEAERLDIRKGKRMLLHFPINHVAADVEIGLASFYGGATVVMMDHFDPAESLKVIEREGITLVGQVPSMFLMQFASPHFPAMDWRHVDTFIWSGSTAPALVPETLLRIAAKTGARVINAYGSTELAGIVTYTGPDDDAETLRQTVGRFVPPFEGRVVDEDDRTLPAGQVGELLVRGASTMKGYLNLPDATAEAIDEASWFHTGDLGWFDSDGRLRLTGRKSEMFISGGENVYPREIEDILEAHPAVALAAVVAAPDPVFQEIGRAFVMVIAGANVSVEELRNHCRAHLANYKVPKQFDLCDSLPLLPTGKVNKLALRERLSQPGA